MTLAAILVLAVGTYAFRFAGPMLRERVELPDRVVRIFELGAIALLAALVVTAGLTAGGDFAGWARSGGLAAGVLAAVLRMPFVGVVLVAAGTAAGLRLLGVA
jgi:branched-subunit amino acid transport protein